MTFSNSLPSPSEQPAPSYSDLTMYALPSEDPPDAWYRIQKAKTRAAEAEARAIALKQQLIESQQQAIAAQEIATEAQERMERLAAKWREFGIDPQ